MYICIIMTHDHFLSFYDFQVLIGHYENLVGHLRYESGRELSKDVIIAVSCSLMVIFIALVLVAYCVYRRKHQTQEQNQNTIQMKDGEANLIHMPPAHQMTGRRSDLVFMPSVQPMADIQSELVSWPYHFWQTTDKHV